MHIELPPLPYPLDGLEPVISARTLATHHGKHHRAYVDKTNTLAGRAVGSLEQLMLAAAGDSSQKVLFNNAAQAWNHAFYWNSLRPRGGTVPREFARFVEPLKGAANGHFGSGWVWLVHNGSEMEVVTTSNAETPLVRAQTPLLVIDVWEHAYYLDHQERRAAHVDAVVDQLLNWDFARSNLKAHEEMSARSFSSVAK